MKKNGEHGQGRILCCQTCGETWTTMDPPMPVGDGANTCPSCIYIELARRHCNARGISLRAAVKRYLVGTNKLKKVRLFTLWKGVQ